MKQFYTFLLLAFATQFIQAQDPVLFDTEWKLTSLVVGGENYSPVSNSEVIQVPLVFIAGDSEAISLMTNVCNSGFGSPVFSDTEPTFFLGFFVQTLIMCNQPENQSFESRYFNFFSGNSPGIFTYRISYLLNFSETPVLSITAANGDIAYYTDANLSTKAFNPVQISISPNPATDQIRVDFESKNTPEVKVEIYDRSGKLIRSENLSAENTIDVQDLAKGIYFLKFKKGNASSTQKFIKI